MSAICALAETIISAPFRHRRWRARKTIICIVMSLQSPEGRLAYIASRANVGFRTRQTQRCARKGYMLIVIGARTDYVICATERSRRPHHDDAYRRGCHPLDVPSGAAKGGGKMTNRNNDPNHVVVDLDLRSMEDKGSRMKKSREAPYMRYIGCRGWRMVPHPLSERYHKSAIHQCGRARGTNFWEG